MKSSSKRTSKVGITQVQEGNRSWWSKNPMAYDWHGRIATEPYSREWFDAIDEVFVHGSRLFATAEQPFDNMIPFVNLRGKRVLEIGCGMGLHTELMTRGGAMVTAMDLTDTAVEATTRRLQLKGLKARVLQADAENLPMSDGSFEFVWSWGVIHHSSRTAAIVRQIARVLVPGGSCRVMVYNREGTPARVSLLRDHLLKGGFFRRSYEETLYRTTDGFSARYYVREQFEDLFRAFFAGVSSEICGQDADAVPLPGILRRWTLRLIPETYLRTAQARRGGFIFLKAANPY